MASVTLDSRVLVPEGVVFREMAGEGVMLHLGTSQYYGLEAVATRMWTLLAEYGEIEPAYRRLLDEYEVEPERLKADLLRFVSQLALRGLLKITGQRSP